MPQVLSPCKANSRGEQKLARILEGFADERLLLCFSVDCFPGVREIDLLVGHRDLGLFFIEVKAVPLEAIASISHDHWRIRGRQGDENPLRQAYGQFEGFRRYWNARHTIRLPPIGVNVCLPEISRHEWSRAFSPESYAGSLAEKLFFQEDLRDDKAFRHRLVSTLTNPAIRSEFVPGPLSDRFVREFEKLFQVVVPIRPTATDRERLRQIEGRINRELRDEFPVEGAQHVEFQGAPGTGKTFRLLAIGTHHAYSGQRVLFVCFNKTLATDVRRLLSFNEKLKLAAHNIEVLDVFQLAAMCFDMYGLPYTSAGDEDEWGRLVVEQLTDRQEDLLERYDTILVDEAHDMQDWQLELIRLHAKPISTVAIACGKGQELYRENSSAQTWLEMLAQKRDVKRKLLRRNYRNTKEQYLAAVAFHEAWPDRHQVVDQLHDRIMRGRVGGGGLEFERGGAPLRYIPVPAIPGEFSNDGFDQVELLAVEYAEILEREVDAFLADDGADAVGLLVLVPTDDGLHTMCAREALRRVSAARPAVSFIDYTVDNTRRSVALPTEIRLCTYMSARGLEGDRVIIFGLEQLEAFAERIGVKPENLGFIVLSRALFFTTVVVRTYFETRVHSLLRKIMDVSERGV